MSKLLSDSTSAIPTSYLRTAVRRHGHKIVVVLKLQLTSTAEAKAAINGPALRASLSCAMLTFARVGSRVHVLLFTWPIFNFYYAHTVKPLLRLLAMAATHHQSLTSSPDLLGGPADDPRSSPVRSLKRARSTTPRKQISQPAGSYQLQDFYIDTPKGAVTRRSSPSKSVAQSENLISPWRIRVRVEAEREDDGIKTGGKGGGRASVSPSKQIGRTITTTVPLKGSDDTPAPQKRGRGRPRKSTTPAKTPAKRPATPKPGKGRKRAADDTNEEEPHTKQQNSVSKSKKPKRNASPKPTKESESVDEDAQMGDLGQPELRLTTLFSSQHGRKDGDFDIAVDSDASIKRSSQATQDQHSIEESNQNDTTVSTAKSTRSKRQPLTSTSPQKGRPQRIIKETIASIHSDRSDEISGYDSIVEGEDFSIVSLSTLPSAQQHMRAQTLAELNGSTSQNPSASVSKIGEANKATPTEATNNLGLREPRRRSSQQARSGQMLTSSELGARQSTDQSSLLHFNFKRTTPSQMFSSPVLPPLKAPQGRKSPKAPEDSKQAKPKLIRDVNTGVALQGVVNPMGSSKKNRDSQLESKQPPEASAQTGLDDLFSGFGARTRRELRAGLRLGEELARRQQQMEEHAQSLHHSEADVFQEIAKSSHHQSTEYNENQLGEAVVPKEVRYPHLSTRKPLPSPDTSLDEKFGQNKNMQVTDEKRIAPPSPGSSVLERQEVSRQIANADSNKVTVVDSDNSSVISSDSDVSDDQDGHHNAGPDDETDIWQTEAKSNSNSQNNSHISSASQQLQVKRLALPSPSHTEPERLEPHHPPETPPPARSQEETDLYLNLSIAVQYATPSPQKPIQQANADFTGFTNFTNDMLESEATSGPKRTAALSPKITKKPRLASSLDPPSIGALKGSTEDAKVSKLRPASASAISWPREGISNAATLGMTGITSSTIPIQKAQHHEQQEQRTPRQEPAFSLASSWLDSVSGSIFKTAADAINAFTSFESLRTPGQPTFCAPITPIVRHVPPFTIYLPFNTTHYTRLRTIYLKAQRHPRLYPLRAASPCVGYLGLEIESMGWMRRLEAWELAVVDDFMTVLKRKGLGEGRQEIGLGAEIVDKVEIGIDEVVKRVFSLWVGQVQKGEVLLKEGVAGRWDRRYVGQRQRALERQRAWKETERVI